MNWEVIGKGARHGIYQIIRGKACEITLEPRPGWCDRGNLIAKIFVRDGASSVDVLGLNLDEQDGWPRYYFDEARAKAEVEAWLTKRKQAIP